MTSAWSWTPEFGERCSDGSLFARLTSLTASSIVKTA